MYIKEYSTLTTFSLQTTTGKFFHFKKLKTFRIETHQSPLFQTSTECLDSISHNTFYIMVVTTIVYGVLVTAGSMSPLSKKTLLVSMFIVVGIGCLIAGLSTNRYDDEIMVVFWSSLAA